MPASQSQSVSQTRSRRALGTRKIATRAHEGKVREGCVGANHELTGLCLYIPRSTTLNLRPPGTRYPVVDVGWWSLGEDVRIRMGEKDAHGPTEHIVCQVCRSLTQHMLVQPDQRCSRLMTTSYRAQFTSYHIITNSP